MAISIIGNSALDVSAIKNGSATLTLPTTSGTILAQNASAPANSLVVDNLGNVGIGTSSPSSLGKFVVLTAQADASDIAVFQRASTATFRIRSGGSGVAMVGCQYADSLAFETNATERMRINSSGPIGVNTGSNIYNTFHVNGGISVQSGPTYATSGAGLELWYNTALGVGEVIAYDRTNNVYKKLDISGTVVTATTEGVERMRIDSAGRVTKPSQPAFKAYASTGVANYTTAGTKITAYDTTTFNIGGHYSTVNKRFTAPIAGVYMFAARAWAAGGNTTGAGINITVNGTSTIATIRIATSSGDYSTMNPFTEVYLNANDYVEVFTETCTATGQVHISQGEAYSGFTGYFLG